jgi:hypothetical protein
MDGAVLLAVVVLAAVLGAWALVAVAFALLAGGVIHARDHQDAPYGGFPGPAPVARLPQARHSR